MNTTITTRTRRVTVSSITCSRSKTKRSRRTISGGTLTCITTSINTITTTSSSIIITSIITSTNSSTIRWSSSCRCYIENTNIQYQNNCVSLQKESLGVSQKRKFSSPLAQLTTIFMVSILDELRCITVQGQIFINIVV